MQTETFNKIRATIETRINKCEHFLCGVETTGDLRMLTIMQAQALQKFCREEEALMTKIVQCDLYHIIGMGNLTASQMMQFIYLVKDYLKYRSTIKAIAMNFDKISTLPSIPMTAVYRAHGFDGLTLFTGTEPLVDPAAPVPYSIAGHVIKVQKDKMTEFINFWSNKAKVSLSENNFLTKAKAGVEYGGVRWTIDDEGDFVGIVQVDNVRQLFEGCYKAPNKNV